jgi:parallel beta-helix repeat protein
MTKFKIGILFLLFTALLACKKKEDTSVLGLDVQPENDMVGLTITDTTSVYMYTQKVDNTIRTYNDQYKYLGSNQDPIFGRTDASIYTNFSISNNLTNVTFGSNPVLDSAELVIYSPGQALGDTSTTMKYDVYLLSEKMVAGTSYSVSSHLLKSSTTVSSLTGKLKLRGTKMCLVLPLDYNMAQYILQTNSNLTNNTAFQNAYKGFYITTSNTTLGAPGAGSIRRFDLDSDLSGVNLYYHDGNSVNTKGQSFQFSLRGSDAVRFNHIDHNYVSGASQNLFDQLNGSESAALVKGNSNVYLNTFGGTRIKMYLPYLKNLTDSQKVSISRAELIVKVDDLISPYTYKYGYPSNLALIACSSDGAEELVFDQLETSDFVKYGGSYDATNKQYVFNIARQVQKILNGELQNYGFYLVNATPNRSYVIRRDDRLERVVLGGKTNPNFKPVFKLTYIKYPYDK